MVASPRASALRLSGKLSDQPSETTLDRDLSQYRGVLRSYRTSPLIAEFPKILGFARRSMTTTATRYPKDSCVASEKELANNRSAVYSNAQFEYRKPHEIDILQLEERFWLTVQTVSHRSSDAPNSAPIDEL